MDAKAQDLLARLLGGHDLTETDDQELVQSLGNSPIVLGRVCHLALNERRALRAEVVKIRGERDGLRGELEAVRKPPLFPGDVLRVLDGGLLDVVCNGRRQIVNAAPELDCSTLRAGDEVLVSRELTTVVRKSDVPSTIGMVATLRAAFPDAGTAVVRLIGEEEMVVLCPPELASSLRGGDRVVVRRESPCLIAKLSDEQTSPFLLEEPPDVSFDDIGGLDDVVAQIRDVLDLSLFHRDLAKRFRIRLSRGITLVGGPGVGKTLIAKGIARYLKDCGRPTFFLNVKPGQLRGIFYGQTENRIRDLFAFARSVPGLCVIFFDEMENFGVRGESAGHAIDDRTQPSLFAELNGLEDNDNIYVVGATNRLDLCDPALVRGFRMGDAIFRIPRPDRKATRAILAKHLPADLPYGEHGEIDAGDVAAAAAGYLFGERDGFGPLATVVFANAEKLEIRARDVVNGALLAAAAEDARYRAVGRIKENKASEGGIRIEDMLSALEDALVGESEKIRSPLGARHLLDIPRADQIVRVEVPEHRRASRHRYVRAAARAA